jgi:hypothetical protein
MNFNVKCPDPGSTTAVGLRLLYFVQFDFGPRSCVKMWKLGLFHFGPRFQKDWDVLAGLRIAPLLNPSSHHQCTPLLQTWN